MHISPESPCRSVGGTSETKLYAVVRLLLVHGGILIASVLGIMGAFIRRPVLLVLGAGLMFLESVPLIFSFAWLTVFVSGLFLLAARAGAPVSGSSEDRYTTDRVTRCPGGVSVFAVVHQGSASVFYLSVDRAGVRCRYRMVAGRGHAARNDKSTRITGVKPAGIYGSRQRSRMATCGDQLGVVRKCETR
jgi:hypothetical protein